MRNTLIAAASALALAACGQQADTDVAGTETITEQQAGVGAEQSAQMTDAQFVQTVANSNAFEIQSSELAAQRAARQDVKQFAQRMVQDHTSATQQLQQLAASSNLPTPTPQLSSDMSSRLDRLRGLTGEEFDDAYLDAQVAAHEEAVRTFESYVANAPAGQLRDWASSTLPSLRTHLSQVQNLENAT
jgi:putative membrane protein